jgi:hypothetical protein
VRGFLAGTASGISKLVTGHPLDTMYDKRKRREGEEREERKGRDRGRRER